MSIPYVEEFSYFLRQRLLTDKYGHWKELDPIFLNGLCDRIAYETDSFISSKVEEQIDNRVANALDDQADRYEKQLEKQEEKLKIVSDDLTSLINVVRF